jgi:hypothetical protein
LVILQFYLLRKRLALLMPAFLAYQAMAMVG